MPTDPLDRPVSILELAKAMVERASSGWCAIGDNDQRFDDCHAYCSCVTCVACYLESVLDPNTEPKLP